MAPLIWALKSDPFFDVKVVNTGQHRGILDAVIHLFSVDVDFALNITRSGSDLHKLTADILIGMTDILRQWRPDMVIVHGDTSTALASALAASYERVSIGHVEAGLRTRDKTAPWPEETNRQMVACLADIHFAPTIGARDNLLNECIRSESVHVTGNTAVDTVLTIKRRISNDPALHARLTNKFSSLDPARKLVVATFHRRENIGESVISICRSLSIISERGDVDVVVTLHPNPAIREPAMQMLSGLPNITLLEPQDYVSFIYLLSKCTLVLTDSGGLQEEAPSLGIPLLLLRNVTERPEAVEVGAVHLVGTDCDRIVTEVSKILDDPMAHSDRIKKGNPYGDGRAANRIRDILKQGQVIAVSNEDELPMGAVSEPMTGVVVFDAVNAQASVEEVFALRAEGAVQIGSN